MIVGEAPGKSEEMMGKCFVGTSGQELDRILADAGIDRASCSMSNVFLTRPENNDLKNWYCTIKQGGIGVPIQKGKYFNAERYAERERLYAEIRTVNPRVIVALGNTATWALLDKSGIGYLRGVVATCKHTGHKVLPTYHPAGVLRQWEFRSTTVLDLLKAKRESEYSEIRFPHLRAIIQPSVHDIRYAMKILLASPFMSYDIETAAGQITCIGFATKGFAITIPFSAISNKGGNYWQTPAEEIWAWRMVGIILASPVPKVTQNGLYDIQYLMKYGIRPRNSFEDTMLLHHSMQPELPKSLGFLGSVYTIFPSWKNMRPKGIETNKKEE